MATARDTLDDLLIRESNWSFDHFERDIARGRPGDIVNDDSSEEGRSVKLTAALIRKAARHRADVLAKVLRDQAKTGDAQAIGLVASEERLVAERRRLRAELARGAEPMVIASLFDDYLAELKARCDRAGTELVVVALPVDVQVDPREWDKYDVPERPDMSESLVLLRDLVDSGERLGLRVLDATAALRQVEPGAFLDHDIHMTAKGHAALALALAERLDQPPPLHRPRPGLPDSLTFVPVAAEWDTQPEILVRGSSKAGCATRYLAGWLDIRCTRQSLRDRFVGIEVERGATPATMVLRSDDGMSLMTPLRRGQSLVAQFHWGDVTRTLDVGWADDANNPDAPEGALVEKEARSHPVALSPVDAALCDHHHTLTGEQQCARESYGYLHDCRPSCAQLWGDPRLAKPCSTAFADHPAKLLACVQNDPLFSPPCPADHVHAFASNRCFAVCDDHHPCIAGECVAWQGGGVCEESGS